MLCGEVLVAGAWEARGGGAAAAGVRSVGTAGGCKAVGRGQRPGEPPTERGTNPGVGLRETLETLEIAGRVQNPPKFTFPIPLFIL